MAIGRKSFTLRRRGIDDVEMVLWERETESADEERFKIGISGLEWDGISIAGAKKIVRAMRRMIRRAEKLSLEPEKMQVYSWWWLQGREGVAHAIALGESVQSVACGIALSSGTRAYHPGSKRCSKCLAVVKTFGES